jgi:lipopolysaccharide transport system ATP-binding protein
MSNTVISVEHLSKKYDLGVIGTGTLSRDLNRWWARLRGKPDPYTRIGQRDHFERMGETILALDDISFSVEQGEALGIIGKNGAGKSTLLKILSRVTAPTSGVVKVKGRIGSLLEVGTGFHPELTGRENVYLNGAILGMRKEEVNRKFDEIVDFSGVDKFIDTPVKRYSSGMYVRLGFAVAAHLDPEILIVDEVLAVGDAEFQKKCLGKMGDVTSEGRTVLFVSHNMTSVQNLCQSGFLINNGQIIQKGKIETIITNYMSTDNITNDLSVRKDRRGGEKFRFLKVEILDAESKKEINSIISGKTVIFRTFFLNRLIDTSKVNISIGINDPYGNRIFSCPSEAIGKELKLDRGKGFVDLIIPKWPLSSGRYFCNLICNDGNKIYDWVKSGFTIKVENGDFYKTGKLPGDGSKGVFIEYDWDY